MSDNQTSAKSVRVRRIGAATSGLALIAVGAVFLASVFVDSGAFLASALRFWPLILVSLGAEILLGTFSKSGAGRKYDAAAVALMLLCLLFAFGCEAARLIIQCGGF